MKTKGENERRDGEGWGWKKGEREGGKPVAKGLKRPFRALVIDLSSIVCKMQLSSVGRHKIFTHLLNSRSLSTVDST